MAILHYLDPPEVPEFLVIESEFFSFFYQYFHKRMGIKSKKQFQAYHFSFARSNVFH